jgi:hypothetical protein
MLIGGWALGRGRACPQDLPIRMMAHWTLSAYLGKVPLLSFCLTASSCSPSSTIAAHRTLISMKRPLPRPPFHVPLRWAENAPPWHLFGDRMWSSSTHIQGHRGRIGSTGIASLSTALAPPSLAHPLPHAGFAIAPCKTTQKAFTLFPYPTSPAPTQ